MLSAIDIQTTRAILGESITLDLGRPTKPKGRIFRPFETVKFNDHLLRRVGRLTAGIAVIAVSAAGITQWDSYLKSTYPAHLPPPVHDMVGNDSASTSPTTGANSPIDIPTPGQMIDLNVANQPIPPAPLPLGMTSIPPVATLASNAKSARHDQPVKVTEVPHQKADGKSQEANEKEARRTILLVDGQYDTGTESATAKKKHPSVTTAKTVEDPPKGSLKVSSQRSDTVQETNHVSNASRPASDGPKLTVVDIGKSGDYVLITNPETRLPVKYQNGSRIHTGESIVSIDYQNARIVTDRRTINMD